jgi:hypothetical protein
MFSILFPFLSFPFFICFVFTLSGNHVVFLDCLLQKKNFGGEWKRTNKRKTVTTIYLLEQQVKSENWCCFPCVVSPAAAVCRGGHFSAVVLLLLSFSAIFIWGGGTAAV